MRKLTLYILLVGGAGVFLIPLLWTVSTALKTGQQAQAVPPQWVPRTYRLRDEAGRQVPVNVSWQTEKPAAVIRLASGPNTGQVLPVEASMLSEAQGSTWVTLRAAPRAYECTVVRAMPRGVAQIWFEAAGAAPGAPAVRAEAFAIPELLQPLVLDTLTPWLNDPAAQLPRFVEPSRLTQAFDPQFGNFRRAWFALPYPFHLFVLNTYTITALSIVGQILSCSLVAYGFARFRFSGRNALFLLLLSTMMLPAQVTMIPVYMLWKQAHLIDTFAPLTIPAWFAQNAFFVFLLRQFFLGIPRELDEAAMIDGCGPLRIWWQVILPLSKPALTTVAVLSFIAHWDDFFGPLIYLNSQEKVTVSIALRLFQDQAGTDYNLLMAAALVHIIPVLVLFFLAQRYFVKGIAMTGIKG